MAGSPGLPGQEGLKGEEVSTNGFSSATRFKKRAENRDKVS